MLLYLIHCHNFCFIRCYLFSKNEKLLTRPIGEREPERQCFIHLLAFSLHILSQHVAQVSPLPAEWCATPTKSAPSIAASPPQSPVSSVAAAPLAQAAAALAGVAVYSVSGEAEQCFFRVVGAALGYSSETQSSGRLHWPQLQTHIRAALDSISSAPLLLSFGFDIDPEANASEVERVKSAYLASHRYVEQRWGGEIEMHLLSHFFKGQLGFSIFSSVTNTWTIYCALPTPADDALAGQSVRR